MKLEGKTVKHLRYGTGKITQFGGKSVEVQFEGTAGRKSFQYPQGFESFLQIQDTDMASEIAEEISENKKLIEQAKNEKEQARLLEEGPQTTKSSDRVGSRKTKLNKKNIVIKCNFCNEGDSVDCISYAKQNLSGVKAGQQMEPEEITPETLAVLTTRTKGVKEEGRVIFALFMVKEQPDGTPAVEGYIQANEDYKIALTFEEAKQIRFWEFYYNEKKPDSIRMGSGLHRYLSDMQCAQVLREIVEMKEDEAEKEYAENFLNYFCSVRKIDVNAILKPEGGLVRLRGMWEK
jgi:hypothetical protein